MVNARRWLRGGIVPGEVVDRNIRKETGLWSEILGFAEENYGERGRLMARMLEVKKGNSSKETLISFLENEGFNVQKILAWTNHRLVVKELKATIQTLYAWIVDDVCLILLKEGSCPDEEGCPFEHPRFLSNP